MCERCGPGDGDAIEGAEVTAGVKSHDPSPVLDQAVLRLDARTIDGDVLGHLRVLTADTGHTLATEDTVTYLHTITYAMIQYICIAYVYT